MSTLQDNSAGLGKVVDPTLAGAGRFGEPSRTAAGGGGPELPDQPLVTIRPRPGWVAIDLRALWASRELLFFLAWRDIKVRYKQTALGVAWAVIQPLFTMLIFTLFFGRLAGVPSDGIPYPLFALAGLLPWTFFSGAVTASGNSLVGSANQGGRCLPGR